MNKVHTPLDHYFKIFIYNTSFHTKKGGCLDTLIFP